MKHMIRIAAALFIVLFCTTAQAQEPLLVNAYNRPSVTLNGKWHYLVDPYEVGYYDYRYTPFDERENPGAGAFFTNTQAKNKSDLVEYDFDKAPTLLAPGDWNSQEEKLFYYEGTVWYKKSFDLKKNDPHNRVFLYFGGANYRADVYLNGKKLGVHRGGFTPFNFEVTELLNEQDNFLIVKVDNKRYREEVPTLNTDWWNYGGITREVKLLEVPPLFIRDFSLQLDPRDDSRLTGFVQLDGAAGTGREVRLTIPELKIDQKVTTDEQGYARLQVSVDQLQRWSPEQPYLYQVTLRTGNDVLEDRIGFRTITTRGQDILLNGQPIFLKGICMHEENPMRGGRAFSREDAHLLLNWAKELGSNFVRLAHYPHNENMVRLADEMGILVWEENPVYWTILWENEYTYNTAEQQLTEVITRDRNRASVIIWSMANETPVSEPRTAFIRNLIGKARSMDPTRLISAALETHAAPGAPTTKVLDDPLIEYVDIMSFNQYVGWYDGLPDKARTINWDIRENKPVVISEFGAGALQGLHGDSLTRWTEEYQENVYKENLGMLQRIPQLRGLSPWILTDFRSPRRLLTDIQDGWNRKGLISETGDKKKAFYVLQDFYRHYTLKNSKKP